MRAALERDEVPSQLAAAAGYACLLAAEGSVQQAARVCCFVVDHPNAEAQERRFAGRLLATLEQPAAADERARSEARDLTLAGIAQELLEASQRVRPAAAMGR